MACLFFAKFPLFLAFLLVLLEKNLAPAPSPMADCTADCSSDTIDMPRPPLPRVVVVPTLPAEVETLLCM
jgi:hypothetical protein